MNQEQPSTDTADSIATKRGNGGSYVIEGDAPESPADDATPAPESGKPAKAQSTKTKE